MDSGEFNKIAGAVIGALLLFMLLGFFSEKIYHGHDSGDVLAYAVEVDDAGPAEAEETIDLAALVAAADPGAGEKVFGKCKACHKLEDGANGVGPHLYNIVGRDIGGVAGFGYSGALADHGGAWDLAALDGFLENPKGWAPGTKMAFGGLSKPEDRVNLIVYLNESGSAPVELAAAPAAEEAPAEEAASEEAPAEEAPADASSTDEAPAEDTATETEASAEPAGESTEVAAAPAADSIYASVTADDGKKVFNKCKACHKLEEGKNGVGPSLYGVIGRDIGSVDGFKYSDALAGKDGAWTAANLDAFLADPKGWAPGNKMSFAGVKDAEQRAAVIVYMNEADGSPEPLE